MVYQKVVQLSCLLRSSLLGHPNPTAQATWGEDRHCYLPCCSYSNSYDTAQVGMVKVSIILT